jgi:hypothetical protein
VDDVTTIKCGQIEDSIRHRKLVLLFQFRSPDIDRLNAEPPVAADPESRDLSALE